MAVFFTKTNLEIQLKYAYTYNHAEPSVLRSMVQIKAYPFAGYFVKETPNFLLFKLEVPALIQNAAFYLI